MERGEIGGQCAMNGHAYQHSSKGNTVLGQFSPPRKIERACLGEAIVMGCGMERGEIGGQCAMNGHAYQHVRRDPLRSRGRGIWSIPLRSLTNQIKREARNNHNRITPYGVYHEGFFIFFVFLSFHV